jgi:phosphoglycerol transferase MdoB-like AlkP superfamily enzyme
MLKQSIFSYRSSPSWLVLFLCTGVLILVLYGYTLIMEDLGGFSTEHTSRQFIELALVIYLYSLFFSILKPIAGRSLLAGLPILLIYLVHDIFYLAFGSVFRLINISELPELLQILPLSYSTLLATAVVIPAGLFLAMVDYRRSRALILWLSPMVILFICINSLPSAFATNFEQMAVEIVKYSNSKSVEYNGRIAMLLYREAQRQSSLDQLEPHRNQPAYNRQVAALVDELQPHNNRRNIHLIVLESFLDPRLFRDLGFSRPPAHPEFDKLFGDKLGLSLAPVFGGATAQAEFEVLCGVPAFELLSSVEFNVFTGAQAHCLPSQLGKLGYRSVATNSYKPNFFNALPGYIGMGFAENYFPQEFSGARKSYLRFGDPGEEGYLFDKSLFEQNLGFIKSHLQQHPDQPLFNYVLTIYGHTPHILDPEKRPEIIELESHYSDDHLERMVNQFYYRTEAIADYVNQLLSVDRESLIILISDHVPPLRNGPNTYKALGYLDNKEKSYYHNRIAIIENGEAKVYPVMRHYELPPLILNYLSNGEYCRQHACAFSNTAQRLPREAYMGNYLRLMAHAAE